MITVLDRTNKYSPDGYDAGFLGRWVICSTKFVPQLQVVIYNSRIIFRIIEEK